MASAPVFANTPVIWKGSISTANTNRDGTGTIVTLGTAPAAGTRIDRIVIKATADPADSIINLFLYDGSAYWLFDAFDIGDPAAASATVDSMRYERAYQDLVLPSGWSLRASITVALTAGVVNALAFGADLT